MPKRSTQTDFFKKSSAAYGGELLMKRKGRVHGRPVSTKDSMHFVLKSSLARGSWSFSLHKFGIRKIIEENAVKFGVQLKSMANVGNHLHLHLQLTNRHTYKAFIRAVSAAIMMLVTKCSRWNTWSQILKSRGLPANTLFWDRRPFSRIIRGFKALLTLRDYVLINRHQEVGASREEAVFMVSWMKANSS